MLAAADDLRHPALSAARGECAVAGVDRVADPAEKYREFAGASARSSASRMGDRRRLMRTGFTSCRNVVDYRGGIIL
jgi:hypothetical protein